MTMEKLVWAKVPQYPWWPAKVIEDDKASNRVRIQFFGDKVIKRESRQFLKPYSQNTELYSKQAKKTSPSIQVLLQQAIEEAEEELLKLADYVKPSQISSPAAVDDVTTEISAHSSASHLDISPTSLQEKHSTRKSVSNSSISEGSKCLQMNSVTLPPVAKRQRSQSSTFKTKSEADNPSTRKSVSSSSISEGSKCLQMNSVTLSPVAKRQRSQSSTFETKSEADDPSTRKSVSSSSISEGSKCLLMNSATLSPIAKRRRSQPSTFETKSEADNASTRKSISSSSIFEGSKCLQMNSVTLSPVAKRRRSQLSIVETKSEADNPTPKVGTLPAVSENKRDMSSSSTPTTVKQHSSVTGKRSTTRSKQSNKKKLTTASPSAKKSPSEVRSPLTSIKKFNPSTITLQPTSNQQMKKLVYPLPTAQCNAEESLLQQMKNVPKKISVVAEENVLQSYSSVSASKSSLTGQTIVVKEQLIQNPSSAADFISVANVCSQSTVSNESNDDGSAGSADEEDLPSYDYLLKGVAVDVVPGEVVWIKYRTYPHWPCLITKINHRKKKVCVKFINSCNRANGLWMKLTCASNYPGEHFAEYRRIAELHSKYSILLSKAIKITEHYLYRKADREAVEPFTYFFPNDAAINDSNEEDELDDEENCGPSVSSESEDCMIEELEEALSNSHQPATFSDETVQRIKERDVWLRKLVSAMQEGKQVGLISQYIQQGDKLTKITEKNCYLGPFAYANELTEELMCFILRTFRSVTKFQTLHMPDWCYTSLIPQIIIKCIENVDGISHSEAKDKYFTDFSTEEEDIRNENQIISSVSRMSEEEKQRHKDILGEFSGLT